MTHPPTSYLATQTRIRKSTISALTSTAMSESEVAQVVEALTTLSVIPAHSAVSNGNCIYATWVQQDAISHARPLIPVVLPREDWSLLYIGAAPFAKKFDGAPLRRVLENHVKGSLASSTLRTSLAALLIEHLRLEPVKGRGRAKVLSERPLTQWIDEYIGFTVIPVQQPWIIEEAVIGVMQPPLNLRKGIHPFRTQVDIARRGLLARCEVTRTAQLHGAKA